ncbi:hypothetical protein DVH24_018970 [Malus domestica]|uniref:Uncharacterized protein n=1 Tax=Malus domestica TaxID=3750 RepID=A0A498KS10_MALDO|nr:hypothetical protein DVH24_018970 [Malus domestica]
MDGVITKEIVCTSRHSSLRKDNQLQWHQGWLQGLCLGGFQAVEKFSGRRKKLPENVYIKKTEQEKLEKLARKGPTPEEKPAASSGGSVSDAKPSASSSGASTAKVSTDKYRNYAVVAGVMTAAASLGWYLKASGKKEEVQD